MANAFLSLLLVLLFSCTDHLAEAEEYKEENFQKSNALTDSALKELVKEAGLRLEISFGQDNKKFGAPLNEIQFAASFQDSMPLEEMSLYARDKEGKWNFQGTISGATDWQSTWSSPDAFTNTEGANFFDAFALGVRRADTLAINLLQWNFTETYANTLHLLNSSAKPEWTLWEQTLPDAAIKSIKGASDHLNLAANGNHQLHLKHVTQYLLGIKGSPQSFLDSASLSGTDTVGAVAQMDHLITLLTQLERSSNWDQEQIELQENLAAELLDIRTHLFELSETVPSWIDEDLNTVLIKIEGDRDLLQEYLDGNDSLGGMKAFSEMVAPLYIHHLEL